MMKYLVDTFGIDDCNMVQKIAFSIEDCQERLVEEQTLWGWGSNTFGQLGLSSLNLGLNIPHPKQIPTPDGFICSIHAYKRGSLLIGEDGKVWATGNFKEEKKERLK